MPSKLINLRRYPASVMRVRRIMQAMLLSAFAAVVGFTVSACNPPSKIIESGNLGKPVAVVGSLSVAFQSTAAGEQNIYAVALASAETTSVIFCKYTGIMQCSENLSNSTVFEKNSEQGFYFASANAVNYPLGTKLLFLAYISKNGAKPTQSAIVDFISTSLSQQPNTANNQSAQIAPITPLQQAQSPASGLDVGMISSILQQLLNTGTSSPTTNASGPPIQAIQAIQPSQSNPATSSPGGSSNELVPNPENIALSATEFEVIRLTNAKRQSLGLSILKVQGRIMTSSRESSRLMKQKNTMVHGLTSGWSRENIAMGHATAAAVVTGWINSPGHYTNMTATNNIYIGVGDTASSGSGIYWTQQFN